MAARTVNKHDLSILSDLVFDSYASKELEFQGVHFVIRTLTTEEREDIARRYQYVSAKFNINLVLEILSNAILFINGYVFKKNEHAYLLNKLNSRLVLHLYSFYQKLDEELTESSKFIDYYIETKESRNLWLIFKKCSRITEPFSIRKINQYRFYWIVMNSYKDSFEEEKKTWSKVEYMTNSICAFVNPKGFRKSRGQMGVVDQLERNEDKTKQLIVEQLEGGVAVVKDNDIFSTLERLPDENKTDHEARVNIMLEKTLRGEIIDDYDKLVRQSEIKGFKNVLRNERKRILVEKELAKQRGFKFDRSEVLTNDSIKIKTEQDKKLGYFFEEHSYLDIVRLKDFAAMTKDEKKIAFDEVMIEVIDVQKEVDDYLKVLSEQTKGHGNAPEPVTMAQGDDNAIGPKTDSNLDVVKTTAERVAKMNVNVKGADLMKLRQGKINRINTVLNQRKSTIKPNDDNLDVIKFGK